MFRAIFGGDANRRREGSDDGEFGSEASSEIDQMVNQILTSDVEPSERRATAYSLRDLMKSERRDMLTAYARAIASRLDALRVALNDSENEEVAQTLLEILTASAERASEVLIKTAKLITILMDVAQNSPFVWVRIGSIQALQALTVASPDYTVEHLQSIPSALETLVGFLSDENVDVRNEMILLLHKLTDCSEQMRKFITFCDGPSVLMRIATEERDTIVSSDCLAICLNILRNNPIGQKLLSETQSFLNALSDLLRYDSNTPDPTPSMLRVARCVEIVRVFVHGRVERKEALVLDKEEVEKDDKRALTLKEVQTKLGATPNLLENLYSVISDVSAVVEDTTKREALYALGDLICQHPRNSAKLERLHGFSHLSSTALTSARWLDAKAAAYAWICALDGKKEGEQRAITLLGHAVAPLPESMLEGDDDAEENRADDAATLVANALYHSVHSIISLREEVYVDPTRLTERRTTTWRAIHLWEFLLISPSCKELALKVQVEKAPLFTSICHFIQELLVQKDETESVKDLVNLTIGGLLRLLIIWVYEDKASADYLLRSASNLFLFEPLEVQDAVMHHLGALLAATCLVTLWDPKEKPVVFGLIENKWGIQRFLRALKTPLIDSQANCDWSSDECTVIILDDIFCRFAGRIAAQADSLLVHGSSSSVSGTSFMPITSATVANGVAAVSTKQSNGPANSIADSELGSKYKQLQQDYARLLLVLAHQELERQSLLQTIQDLGGEDALDNALRRSAALLSKAFEHHDNGAN